LKLQNTLASEIGETRRRGNIPVNKNIGRPTAGNKPDYCKLNSFIVKAIPKLSGYCSNGGKRE
jgi:hypothetical protein